MSDPRVPLFTGPQDEHESAAYDEAFQKAQAPPGVATNGHAPTAGPTAEHTGTSPVAAFERGLAKARRSRRARRGAASTKSRNTPDIVSEDPGQAIIRAFPIREGAWPEEGPLDPRNNPAAKPAVILNAQEGLVQIQQSKIALVGFAASGRQMAPYTDPEWGIWTLNQLYRYAKRADLHAEIHAREVFEADIVRDTDYVGWLRTCPIPVFMMERFDDIPASVRFPIERLNAWIGNPTGAPGVVDGHAQDYLTSTPAYMLAYVLWSRAIGLNAHITDIGVWGIDLIVGMEYDYQKACMEFWLGLAKGLGLRLQIHEKSALLKTLQRYGLSKGHVSFGPFTHERFQFKFQQLTKRKDELIQELNRIDGALHVIEGYEGILTLAERCGHIPPAPEYNL